MKRLLITGGAGFVGSNFCNYFIPRFPNCDAIVYDKLTYAGNRENLRAISGCRNVRFVHGDVCDFDFLQRQLRGVDAVVHLAAESHVDHAIGDSLRFTCSNTLRTHVLLEAARICGVTRIIVVGRGLGTGQLSKNQD